MPPLEVSFPVQTYAAMHQLVPELIMDGSDEHVSLLDSR